MSVLLDFVASLFVLAGVDAVAAEASGCRSLPPSYSDGVDLMDRRPAEQWPPTVITLGGQR